MKVNVDSISSGSNNTVACLSHNGTFTSYVSCLIKIARDINFVIFLSWLMSSMAFQLSNLLLCFRNNMQETKIKNTFQTR